MEQTIQYLPWSEILRNPNSAWALVFIVLLIYTMHQNGKREERLTGIIDGTLKEITSTLAAVCTNVESLKEEVKEIKRGDV